MALELRQTYRLVPRGDPGLTCDYEGAALGGIPIAWRCEGDDSMSRWQTRSPDEIGDILQRAYGQQRGGVVERFHRGLRRMTNHLEAGDPALAAMEALMLRLPTIDADGMSKLAGLIDLLKGGDASRNEPRIPAGQPGGGQWTTGGSSVGTPSERQDRSQGADGRSDRVTEHQASQGGSQTATDEGAAGIPEFVAPAPIAQSRRQSANGFYVNRAGGGVFFIPTTAGETYVRPTEVHALDASAFQVSWDEKGVISLKSAEGTIVKVPATPDDLKTFNATTGRALGVAIYTFPGTPLGSPDNPPTVGEERELAEARAA